MFLSDAAYSRSMSSFVSLSPFHLVKGNVISVDDHVKVTTCYKPFLLKCCNEFLTSLCLGQSKLFTALLSQTHIFNDSFCATHIWWQNNILPVKHNGVMLSYITLYMFCIIFSNFCYDIHSETCKMGGYWVYLTQILSCLRRFSSPAD